MDDFGSKLIRVTQNDNVFEVEDILTNILSRLPVKSLLICKSVSKYWRDLICSPSFMHSHLVQSRENSSYAFYPSYPSWDDNIPLLTKTDGETTQSFLDCDGFYFEDGRLVGHILAVDKEENFSTIRIPEEETMRPFLVNLEGCLCLVARHGLGQLDIWALQDSKESVWMKKWSDNIPQNFNIQGLSYVTVQKNEILLANWVRSVFYNMETRTWREFNWEHAHETSFLFQWHTQRASSHASIEM
ncbi:hypothetical protein CK203_029909 [Vitis vinifera]|uniref:F-box domain-containing protein n=1 Tax=Vitis vinifera TaxID=29760 RepID=A0A438IDM5_VITVI|nr:hypothetical protein CK203_029909 [Vitis vinifera]